MNLRDLFERQRAALRKPGELALRTSDIAQAAELSRQHLYCLLSGAKGASREVLARLARTLRVPLENVQTTLAVSRKEYLVAHPKPKKAKKAKKAKRKPKRAKSKKAA